MKARLFIISTATAFAAVAALPHRHHAYSTGLAPRQTNESAISATDNVCRRLLVGAAGQIVGFDFNGSAIRPSPHAKLSEPGKTASWMTFKEPNLLYAVDENSNATRLFNYNPSTGELSKEVVSWNGSSGVVHLAFNADKSRLIGSSYGQGQVDIWDSSAQDGTLKLLKQVILQGDHGPDQASQTQLRAHQAVLDPSGRFFVINDLGGDKLHVLDSANDSFSVTAVTQVSPPGSGPRHGVFVSLDGSNRATHYLVVCELTNKIQLFSVSYNNGLSLTYVQLISTFPNALGPANATSARAGELIVSTAPGPAYIYVSNRNTGYESDFITRFGLDAKSNKDSSPQLVFKDYIMTYGITPRMFSFSKDSKQEYLFIANVNGLIGIQARARCQTTDCGMRSSEGSDSSMAAWPGSLVGPQFVMEV